MTTAVYSHTRPSVLVLGGGYGGIAVAKGLDDVADVTLVEPKDAFVHNVAALRALVAPEWLPKIFLPYDHLLQNGRVVRDRVVRLEGRQALLASGSAMDADFVVLATGSSYPFPAKSDSTDTLRAHEHYRATHEALRSSGRVLIVGAGAVGLELAGEIAAVWPEKRITIVDLANDILPGGYRAELRRQLGKLGIELVLGSPLRENPPTPPGVRQPFSVRTEAGTEIAADIWFRAYGIAPITDYLVGELAGLRTPEGYVRVTPYLELPGQEGIFAVGDIAAGHPNGAGRAGRHGDLVAANLRTLITGQGELLEAQVAPPAIILPLGPEGGAGQRPDQEELLGPEAVAEIKGRDMMIDRFAEKLGVLQCSS
jgi:NADH dehydrogenase FAD-containing subunit